MLLRDDEIIDGIYFFYHVINYDDNLLFVNIRSASYGWPVW